VSPDGELLSELIKPAPVVRAGSRSYPILSMTMHQGLVDQQDKFKKRVASIDTSPYKVVARGQLVIGFPIDEGVLSFQDRYDRAIVSPAYEIWDLLDQTRVDRRYLERYLRSPRALAYYSAKLQGTTARRRSLPRDSFLGLQVPLPAYSEQKKIAQILELADAQRLKRLKAIGLFGELGQSIFLEMFGNPARNPCGWPMRKIGDLIESATYGTSVKAGAVGDLPMLRMNNITPAGEIDLTDLKYLKRSETRENYLIHHGDILFNRTNSPDLVGKTAIYRGTESLAYAGYLVRVRTDSSNNPEYLSAFLNSRYAKLVLRNMCKSIIGMANINAKELQEISIAEPPRDIQLEFARRIHELELLKLVQRRHLASLGSLFTSLQGRAFRGEL